MSLTLNATDADESREEEKKADDCERIVERNSKREVRRDGPRDTQDKIFEMLMALTERMESSLERHGDGQHKISAFGSLIGQGESL